MDVEELQAALDRLTTLPPEKDVVVVYVPDIEVVTEAARMWLNPNIVEQLARVMFKRTNPTEMWKLIDPSRQDRWVMRAKLIWDAALTPGDTEQ